MGSVIQNIVTPDSETEFIENFVHVTNLYGIVPGLPFISDHADFTNPRSTVNPKIIAGVREAGKIDDPILLYLPEDENKYVILDGKNRATASLLEWMDNPDTPLQQLPCSIFTGSPIEAKGVQISRNLPDKKSDLSEEEIFLAIKSLKEKDGLSREEICGIMGWKGKTAARRWNEYCSILDLPDEVTDRFLDGHISKVQAIALADTELDEEELVVKAEELTSLNLQGVGNLEASKALGIRVGKLTSFTTKEMVETIKEYTFNIIPYLITDESFGGEGERIKQIKNIKTLIPFLDERKLIASTIMLATCMRFQEVDIEDIVKKVWNDIMDKEDKETFRTLPTFLTN